MAMLSFVFTVILTVILTALISTSAQTNQTENGISLMPPQEIPPPFKVCLDDSDCSRDGKVACFRFFCYPWKDDSEVAPKDRIPLCRKNKDCQNGKRCYRHYDRRVVSRGLCLDEFRECDQGCEMRIAPVDEDQRCCGPFCCEKQYYESYRLLPCSSNRGCEDLGIGKFCCPRPNGMNSICCNTDPNQLTSTTTPVSDIVPSTSAPFDGGKS